TTAARRTACRAVRDRGVPTPLHRVGRCRSGRAPGEGARAVICRACGFENPSTMKFCGACAAQLASHCPSCGRDTPPGFQFCGACGVEVRGVRVRGSGVTEREPLTPHPSTPNLLSHTPKHLAEKILQSKSALEGERKQVTVLFADVKGSMELEEQLD